MSSALTVFTHYISCLRFNVKVLQRENVLNCKKEEREAKREMRHRKRGLTSTARNRQQSGEHEGIFGMNRLPQTLT